MKKHYQTSHYSMRQKLILAAAFLFFSLLSSSSYAQQSWQPLGPDDFGQNPIGNTIGGSNSLFIAQDGTPYISYSDADNNYKATVKKFDGSNWVAVGNTGFSADIASTTSLSVAPDGTPYLGYWDTAYNGKATVKKFNGTNWITVGSSGFSPTEVNYFNLAIAPDGSPYICYSDVNNRATVMKFNGTSWVIVGVYGFSAGEARHLSLAISSDGTPYVGYSDSANNNKATVMKFNGTSWLAVGTIGFSDDYAQFISLAISPDGTPYIGYRSGGYKAKVMKFEGTSWVTVGSPGLSTTFASDIDIVIGPDGFPYIGYQDYNGGNKNATVKKFNGISWENVGVQAFSAGDANVINIALTPNNSRAIVSYASGSGGSVFIKYYDLTASTPPPTAASFQTYCNGATVADLQATGTSIQWYAAPEGGTPLTSDTMLLTATYYVSQTLSGLESTRTHVNVVINSGTLFYADADADGFGNPVVSTTSCIQPEGYVANNKDCDDTSAEIGECAVTTQIMASFCNTTQSFSNPIYANNVSGASQYRFRINDGANVQVIERPSRYFTMNQFSGYTYSKTYAVNVAAFVNGQWTAYGQSCNISTGSLPAIQIRAVHCGTTVSFIANIYANAVNLATAYRFRVTEGANIQYIEKPSPYFTVNEISGYAYNKTYTIAVAAGINGQWADYGSTCTISTPSHPTSQLDTAFCGATMPSVRSVVYAKNVSQATGYRFRITDGVNSYLLENTARYFILNHVPGNGYGKTYSVEVAVQHSGSWGPYGATCTVSTPSAMLNRQGDVSSEDVFEAGEEVTEIIQPQAITLTSYPNPYTDAFTIDMSTHSAEKVTVRTFDMNGRLVEDIMVSPEELSSQKLGNRYAAGIYNVIVMQGDYQKAFKVVKR